MGLFLALHSSSLLPYSSVLHTSLQLVLSVSDGDDFSNSRGRSSPVFAPSCEAAPDDILFPWIYRVDVGNCVFSKPRLIESLILGFDDAAMILVGITFEIPCPKILSGLRTNLAPESLK